MPAPATHEAMVVSGMWRRDTSHLTRFSANSEYTFNTFSEPRGLILRASTAHLVARVLQKPYRGFSRLVSDLLPAMALTVAAL
jgi:hypothetical protein